MFELDDGLEELQEAAGEFVEEESEDAAGEAFDEFDSENLLAHWNSKEQGESLELVGIAPPAPAKPVIAGPSIKVILTQLQSQVRSLFGEKAELLEVPMEEVRSTLRQLFPPPSRPRLSEDDHNALQKKLHQTLNRVEDIMDSLVIATQAGA